MTCHGHLMRAWVPPIAWCTVAVAYRLQTAGAKSGDRPCRKFAFPMAREGGRVGHDRSTLPGRVWPGADDPWGHCKAIRRRVGGFMAVHHTLKPPARAGFGPLCTKFGTSQLGFLVCGDGTEGFHACQRVLLDAPGPHLACQGHLMRAWDPHSVWHKVAYRLQTPRVVTGRAGKVRLPHGTGRWMCRPWRQYTCWDGFACVPMDPGDTARPFVDAWGPPGPCITPSTTPGRPISARFPAKFATSELGFLVCGDGTGGD